MADNFKVADLGLAEKGRKRIEWAESPHAGAHGAARGATRRAKPLAGMRIAGCLHVTKETAVLVRTLRAAGAEVSWSGCNPLSTQDDVAAALAAEGMSIYAWHGMNVEEFYWCIEQDARDQAHAHPRRRRRPHLHASTRKHRRARRRRSSAAPRRPPPACTGCAPWPPTASCSTRSSPSTTPRPSGTSTTSTAPGQSSLDGILRATSVLLAGKNFVVAGYGHCGRGVRHARQGHGRQRHRHRGQADRGAQGHPRGLPGHADGRGGAARRHLHHRHRHEGRHRRAALRVDEGRRDRLQHRPLRLRDQPRRPGGADRPSDARSAPTTRSTRSPTAGRIYLLAKGRLVNLAAAEGHPSRGHGHVLRQPVPGAAPPGSREGAQLEKQVHDIPEEQDEEIALLKLETMGLGSTR